MTKKLEAKDGARCLMLYKTQIEKINYLIAVGRSESAADTARKGIDLLFSKVKKEKNK